MLKMYLLISIRTCASSLIIFGTIDIWAVVKGPIPSADRPAASLV